VRLPRPEGVKFTKPHEDFIVTFGRFATRRILGRGRPLTGAERRVSAFAH
jgi:hypothetical protein